MIQIMFTLMECFLKTILSEFIWVNLLNFQVRTVIIHITTVETKVQKG